jgi:hypothetical protein
VPSDLRPCTHSYDCEGRSCASLCLCPTQQPSRDGCRGSSIELSEWVRWGGLEARASVGLALASLTEKEREGTPLAAILLYWAFRDRRTITICDSVNNHGGLNESSVTVTSTDREGRKQHRSPYLRRCVSEGICLQTNYHSKQVLGAFGISSCNYDERFTDLAAPNPGGGAGVFLCRRIGKKPSQDAADVLAVPGRPERPSQSGCAGVV